VREWSDSDQLILLSYQPEFVRQSHQTFAHTVHQVSATNAIASYMSPAHTHAGIDKERELTDEEEEGEREA
jgi:hypothetical protein